MRYNLKTKAMRSINFYLAKEKAQERCSLEYQLAIELRRAFYPSGPIDELANPRTPSVEGADQLFELMDISHGLEIIDQKLNIIFALCLCQGAYINNKSLERYYASSCRELSTTSQGKGLVRKILEYHRRGVVTFATQPGYLRLTTEDSQQAVNLRLLLGITR